MSVQEEVIIKMRDYLNSLPIIMKGGADYNQWIAEVKDNILMFKFDNLDDGDNAWLQYINELDIVLSQSPSYKPSMMAVEDNTVYFNEFDKVYPELK